MMSIRKISYIIIHCSATNPNARVEAIQRYWKEEKGWKSPGYHYIIQANGTVVQLEDESKPTNGVTGYNANSMHVCYIGGIDEEGKAKDTRTIAQHDALIKIVSVLKKKYPGAEIKGHRDFLVPGRKWKDCPSFDVKQWLIDSGIDHNNDQSS